jgi:two-component system nitrogen regulation sensor histidine kinase NtrY
MASRSYRLELLLRVGSICAAIYLFFFLAFETSFSLSTALVGIASAALCVSLFRSIDKRNRVLAHFLESMRSADFSRSPAFPGGKSFALLKAEYDSATEELRRRAVDQERKLRYVETIAESAGIGFVVFDEDGRIDFANDAFKSMLGCGAIRGIEELDVSGGGFLENVRAMKNGEKSSIRLDREGDRLELLVSVRDFILHQVKYRLVSLQNIRSELEAGRMDAWQEPARVLMHEIMNSIAPISSLAFSATAILSKVLGSGRKEGQGRSDDERDAMSALETIAKRSRSLLAFVDNYRKVLKVPTPAFALVRCDELLGEVRSLMEGPLRERRIALELSVVPTSLRLSADEGLLAQVLINLVKNSMEALESAPKPKIEIAARLDTRGRPIIEVADNGRGIRPENLERIFIPFYTTKNDGSGVGLSFCRKIMRLHGGSISPSSKPGLRTVFALRF